MAFGLASGCSATYQPRPSPRINTVIDGGQLKLQRDGQQFSTSFLSNEALAAVSGNPEAETHARSYLTRSRWGFPLNFFGVGSSVAGLSMALDKNFAHREMGAALAVSGFAMALVGVWLGISGQARLHDAVNVYNDGLNTPSEP